MYELVEMVYLCLKGPWAMTCKSKFHLEVTIQQMNTLCDINFNVLAVNEYQGYPAQNLPF